MMRRTQGSIRNASFFLCGFALFSCSENPKSSPVKGVDGTKDGGMVEVVGGVVGNADARTLQNTDTGSLADTTIQREDASGTLRDSMVLPPPDASRPLDSIGILDGRSLDNVRRDSQGSQDVADTGSGSACSPACSGSQVCQNGTCITSVNSGADGCTDVEAANLTLAQIAVYQTVKIPLMDKGAEVATNARNADVIQGKDAVFRVFVTIGGGYVARELSARLTLTNESPKVFFSKKTIAVTSTDGNTANSFQIVVPGSEIVSGTQYSVQIVECKTSDASGKTRFPATGQAALGARATGSLKVKIIPIQVGNFLPDTSTAAMDLYTRTLQAMYPITTVEFSIGDTLTTTSPVNWTSMLDQLRAKRRLDAPAADVYYFGMVKPAETLRAYCSLSCTMGIGYVAGTTSSGASARAAVGTGFGDKASAEAMAHEIGHNHGRNHAPCAPGGSISGLDQSYPYSGGLIGSWGYDARTQVFVDPARSTDLMAYCSNKWLSDYTYKGLTNRVALINGATLEYMNPATIGRYRVLLLDETGPRWGIPFAQAAPPDGVPEEATVYDASGAPITIITVYRTEISDIQAAMVQVPEPQANWHTVGVRGSTPHPFHAPVTVPSP